MQVRSLFSFWSVALLCSFINCIHLGLKRIVIWDSRGSSSGTQEDLQRSNMQVRSLFSFWSFRLQFVACMERYDASREQSAFSMMLGAMVCNLCGPVVGFLGTKFGIKNVTICGCVIASFSMAACFLAEDITFVTLCFGIPLGISTAMSVYLLPSLLHVHYKEDQAFANGIAVAGPSLGAIGLSPLYKLLLDTYGVSGAFLMMGAVALHSVPAAMFLANPKSETVDNKTKDKKYVFKGNYCNPEKIVGNSCSKTHMHHVHVFNRTTETSDLKVGNFSDENNRELIASKDNLKNISEYSEKDLRNDTENQAEPVQTNSSKINTTSYIPFKICEASTKEIEYRNFASRESHTEIASYLYEKGNNRITSADYDNKQQTNYDIPANTKPSQTTETNGTVSRKYYKAENISNSTETITTTNPKPGKEPRYDWTLFRILYDPLFLLVSITISSHMVVLLVIITVMVDFDIDKGLTVDQGVYMLICLNVADMIGRFSLGWVTDNEHVSVTNFTALCYFFLAIFLAMFAVVTDFVLVMSSLAAASIFTGALMTIFNVLVSEYFKGKMNTMALASKYITMVPACLAISPLIGFFREDLGSYVLMFYFIGGVCILCCIIILLLPTVARCRTRNEEDKLDG